MKDNPNRRKAIIWAIVMLLVIFAMFMPYLFGMYEFHDIYPYIAMGFIIIGIPGITVTIYYVQQARLLDRILKEDNILAHWIYSREEWDQYAETEYRVVNKENRALYYIVPALALLFGILYIVFSPKPYRSWGIILFSFIALSPLVAWFSAWYDHRRNRKYLGEAYITRDAVYLSRRLATWRGLGRRLESVVVADNESQQLLVIIYSDPHGDDRQEYTIRVPVPRGQEKAAEEIAEKLNYSK
jgi:hypothetical protein